MEKGCVRLKVLQINCVYRKGSTGKIVLDLHKSLLDSGYESVVLYGRGKRIQEENVYKVSTELEGKVHSALSRAFGVDFGFSPIATANAIRIIKKEKPDVVHLHCLNGHFVNVYRLVKFLKRNRIKTVLTLHAEIMHTAGCEHAMYCEKWMNECHDCAKIKGFISKYFRDDARHCYRLMKDAFACFESLTVVGVSDWITERAKKSPIFVGAKFATVHNGINTDVFQPREYAELKKRLNLDENKKIILHVTPNFNHAIKGGKYVIELARMMPEYQFIIVGFNGDAEQLPPNVLPIAHTQDQIELAQYYSMADCCVITSLRETFPTVCLEAAACGTPMVGFTTGGVPEGIPERMGETVMPYSIDDMRTAVMKWTNQAVADELLHNVRLNLRKFCMLNTYMELYME